MLTNALRLERQTARSQSGFTLVELLIAVVINIILLAALIGVFSSNIANYNKVNRADMLNQQLENAIQLMTNDIRRAGYSANASNDIDTGQNNNPFMASATDISTPSSTCILFTYDAGNTGTLPSINASADDDRYGFRLNNNTLQARPPGATFACNAAATNWENITDPNIVNITALSFTLNTTTVPVGQTANTIRLRSVDISITGQLVLDASISKTLTQHVRVRNDKFVP
jgi:type IV pilus assembly protein PilW